MLAKDEVLQGRYRIVRRLGQGGMGAVYEAIDKRLDAPVALKEIIIDFERIRTEESREQLRRAFRREARLLAALNHEVFPRVTDYFTEQNGQFLIMELVGGDDLNAQLSRNKKPFPLEDVLQWSAELLDALEYLHTRQPPIYHRDIKPQNLKVTERNHIKLLDFGIAKSVDRNGSTLTNQTLVGATPEFAPIEQLLPAIEATYRDFIVSKHRAQAEPLLSCKTDARYDIYAVGATVYHLLTGRVPINAARRSLQIWENHPDPLPVPHELEPSIPVAVSDWILKAMAPRREDRYATSAEMRDALRAIVAELAAPKEPPAPEPDDEPEAEMNSEPTIVPEEPEEQNQPSATQPAETLPSPYPPPVVAPHVIIPIIEPPPEKPSEESESEEIISGDIKYPLPPSVPPRKKFGAKALVAGVAALCVLVAGGFGIRALINRPVEVKPEKPVFNLSNSAASSATPNVNQNVSPNVNQNASPAPVTNGSQTVSPKPKPVVSPKKRSSMSDDCLYNGRC